MRWFLALVLALATQTCVVDAQEAIRNRAVKIIGGVQPTEVQPETPVPMVPPILAESELRMDNPAGLKLVLLPGAEIPIGAKMAVRVSTEKPGYLVVIDVDSAGRLTQIYPNTHSLAEPRGAVESANLLARDKPRLIPDPKDKVNFEFVAAAPIGVGMLMAILSDKPVQMIDLPDVPDVMAGQLPAVEYVRETTRSLKLLSAKETGPGRFQDPKWSFATQFYVIK